ncbi:MAG: hypothetical protein GTN62_02325 [Gemmatimonadales bacterium]|nr:hypothetical protein [Gemmatimonadales bacterium]NIN10790.1 hypothetical protein [Gemmatimonadales bacterium]NIN48936.1 hypothetical protein [Gemmatimonadales bacterium]NIP06400.1 hypothetical protein [Gemmatimonadales bacterium]NIR00211.1 hypothetical protein [Gemmatimonadales bacterium]
MRNTLSRLIAALGTGVGLALTAGSASAQVEITSKAMEIKLTGRAHAQWNTSSVDAEPATTFLLRRARIVAEVKVNDFVFGKVEPEYGRGNVILRDAYVRLTFSPFFRWTIGQFKRPFDQFQLRTSTQILMIEREGPVRGVDTCAGVGSICAFSRFTSRLEYSERDIGFMFDGQLGSAPFRYYASVMNGRGDNHSVDENGTKSYTGRLEYGVAGLRVGAHLGVHDYPNDSTGTDEYGVAFGGDVDWGEYEQIGLHVKAGVVYGDNWRNLATPDPSKFFAAQAAATYRVPIRDNRFLYAVGPVARVSWGDPDTDVGDDDGWLLTGGVAFFFTGRNKLALNVDIWRPAAGETEYSLKAQSYMHF